MSGGELKNIPETEKKILNDVVNAHASKVKDETLKAEIKNAIRSDESYTSVNGGYDGWARTNAEILGQMRKAYQGKMAELRGTSRAGAGAGAGAGADDPTRELEDLKQFVRI